MNFVPPPKMITLTPYQACPQLDWGYGAGSNPLPSGEETRSVNFGIGTDSPTQKLHVEGQCVTGDTPLPIIHQDVTGSYTEEIPIVEVRPGDYVLSLNEQTGKIEPRRIKGLLDMGVKPVFELTTARRRKIRTTGNHPCLIVGGWRRVIDIEVGEKIAISNKNALSRFSLSPLGKIVMNNHDQENKAEGPYNREHDYHLSFLSNVNNRYRITSNVNIAQKTILSGKESLVKNSPTKNPARTILAKSLTSFAIESLDFGVSHFIPTIKSILESIFCQAKNWADSLRSSWGHPLKGTLSRNKLYLFKYPKSRNL